MIAKGFGPPQVDYAPTRGAPELCKEPTVVSLMARDTWRVRGRLGFLPNSLSEKLLSNLPFLWGKCTQIRAYCAWRVCEGVQKWA